MAMGVGLRRSGRRGRDDLPLSADINVTSLVDVAFTLLVIFIITAPILQGGVEVAIPQGPVQPLTATDDLFIVTITREGKVFLEDTEVPLQELERSFAQLVEAGQIKQVYVKGDSLAPYGPVLKVVATAARAGVLPGLVGEPEPRPARRR